MPFGTQYLCLGATEEMGPCRSGRIVAISVQDTFELGVGDSLFKRYYAYRLRVLGKHRPATLPVNPPSISRSDGQTAKRHRKKYFDSVPAVSETQLTPRQVVTSSAEISRSLLMSAGLPVTAPLPISTARLTRFFPTSEYVAVSV